MKIEKINTHKKYKNTYFLKEGQVYSYEEMKDLFLLDDELLQNTPLQNSNKKPYRYKKENEMQKQIDNETLKLKEEYQIEPANFDYDNLKVINSLINFFTNKISYDSSVLEERLFNIKNNLYELQEQQKIIVKAYENKAYQKEKAYKKAKRILKQAEKQIKLQQTKVLFDTLVRKKTTNYNDCYTLLYLLNSYNIGAYHLVMKNKITNKHYSLILFPYKKNQYDALKYYICDTTKLRHQKIYNEKQAYAFFGKDTLHKEYSDYSYVKLENLEKVLLSNEKEFTKIIKQVSKENLEI